MKKIGLFFIVVLVAVGGYWLYAHRPVDLRDSPQGKLNDEVQPLHYQIDLTIDPKRDDFSGHVVIKVNLLRDSARLWMHGQNLSVENATVTTQAGKTFTAEYEEVGDSGVVELRFGQTISAQALTLTFDYHAPFDRTLNGLYLVEDGDKRYAFTQFESHFARRAFPSFDEPRFKVPFDVSLTVDANEQAIANTSLRSEEALSDHKKKMIFNTTKPLPTYLLAWAVGELDVVTWAAIPTSSLRDREIPLRGVATKGKGEKIKYALEHTAGIVQTLENYFGIPYPYEKLDILAVPDFEAGAMENAGAITYREQLLLINEQSSIDEKRAYAAVHAHELAHQWFGNLVTMPWWNDIWLNEAFASWMENKAVNRWAPDWGFGLSQMKDANGAMQLDSLKSMREIRQPIQFNHEISNAFDGITYSKGSAVIGMIENYVGEAVFQRGVQRYLTKYSWGSATAEQFVASIAEAAQDDRINSAFFSFLTQVGAPQISMTAQCEGGKVSAVVSQQRYLPLASKAPADTIWQVPVCVKAYGNGEPQKACVLLSEKQQNWSFELPHCPTHYVLNADGAGYYRTHYSQNEWPVLLANLNAMSVAESYSVVQSMNAALDSGAMSVNDYLQAVPAITQHPEREVLTAPMGKLGFIQDYVVAQSEREQLQHYYASLYQPQLLKLGIEGNGDETVEQRLLRNDVINFMAFEARDKAVRQQLAQWGNAYMGLGGDEQLHADAVPSDMIENALKVAVEEGGETAFRAAEKLLDSSDDGTVRDNLIAAMAATSNEKLADEMRGKVLGTGLRTNERMGVLFVQLSGELAQADAVFQWLKGKYRFIRPLMPEGVQNKMPMIGMRYCSDEKFKEINDYFTPLMEDLPGGQRALDNTLERIELCAALVKSQPAIQWEPLSVH